jgi:outer membrane PBP1 activator LpoA protein
MLAPLVALALPALSFAQSPPASETTPRMAPPPIVAPGVVPQPAPVPIPDAAAAPVREPVAIALVLPLQSTTYGQAAEAVQAGFAAAADAAREKYALIVHGDGDVRAAFDKARNIGARVVVGPLVRDDLKTIADAGGDLPWTIALNQLDERVALPGRIYTLALSIESEARQLARRIHDQGAKVVGTIVSDSPLQKRFASAFIGEWILLGGAAPVTFHFGRAPDLLTLLRREIGRARLDAILVALDANEATLAKPYLGQVPAYTSSQVNDRQPPEARRDLDDLFFIETPWLAEPSAAAFASTPRREFANNSLDRLYALGVDAFRVAQAFANGAPEKLAFDGATGHLTLEGGRQFARDGVLLQFRAGEIVPAPIR